MTLRPFLTAIFGLALLSSPANAVDPAKLRSWIAYFKANDPIADAAKDSKEGKTHVISAMGVGQYYPGIENHETGDRIAKKHGVKHLPATSDAIESELHGEYIRTATDYARKYNEKTLQLLGEANQ